MGLSDAVNDWKDLISNIPRQYYAVFIKKYNFFVWMLFTNPAMHASDITSCVSCYCLLRLSEWQVPSQKSIKEYPIINKYIHQNAGEC